MSTAPAPGTWLSATRSSSSGSICRHRQRAAPLPHTDHDQYQVQTEQQHREIKAPRKTQVQFDRIDHQPPMPVFVHLACHQKRGEDTGPCHHRIHEGPCGRREPSQKVPTDHGEGNDHCESRRVPRDRPATHRESGTAPTLLPLPKTVDCHGGVKGVQRGLHVQARTEKYPDIETGTDERGGPALEPLPNREKEVHYRERRRDEFGPTRVAPCTHELDPSIGYHRGATPDGAESGGPKPGSTFMTNTSCGPSAKAAERAISCVRIAITWSRGPQICVARALVRTIKPG